MKTKVITIAVLAMLLLTSFLVMSTAAKEGTVADDVKLEESVFLTCFPAGVKITMADGTAKNIEDVEIGDMVRSYNPDTKEISSWEVQLYGKPKLRVWSINDGLLEITEDHPLRVKKQDGKIGWGSIVPLNTHVRLDEVLKIEVGDSLFTDEGTWIEVTSITFDDTVVRCYNILSRVGTKTYFANGILTFEEHPPALWMMRFYMYNFFAATPILKHFKYIFAPTYY